MCKTCLGVGEKSVFNLVLYSVVGFKMIWVWALNSNLIGLCNSHAENTEYTPLKLAAQELIDELLFWERRTCLWCTPHLQLQPCPFLNLKLWKTGPVFILQITLMQETVRQQAFKNVTHPTPTPSQNIVFIQVWTIRSKGCKKTTEILKCLLIQWILLLLKASRMNDRP